MKTLSFNNNTGTTISYLTDLIDDNEQFTVLQITSIVNGIARVGLTPELVRDGRDLVEIGRCYMLKTFVDYAIANGLNLIEASEENPNPIYLVDNRGPVFEILSISFDKEEYEDDESAEITVVIKNTGAAGSITLDWILQTEQSKIEYSEGQSEVENIATSEEREVVITALFNGVDDSADADEEGVVSIEVVVSNEEYDLSSVSRSASRGWTTPDISPEYTGEVNATNLNAAMGDGGKRIKVCTPGVYDFDNTIWVPSNTDLYFCPDITIRKETGSGHSHMIANKGMLTQSGDTNIKIYGNGLNLDMNGINVITFDPAINPVFKCKSLLELYKVTNFIVDDIFADNMDMTSQFFFTMTRCTDGAISNIDQRSYKNSINFAGGCKRVTATNIKMAGLDDDYFIGIGYPQNTGFYGDTEDITIINHTSIAPNETVSGNVSRIWGGSWSDWVSGMTVHDQENVVASNGLVYAKGWNSGGNQVSTVEPSHTGINEHPILADGIEWWLCDTGGETIYSCSVRRVSFINLTLGKKSPVIQFYNPWVTGGTEGTYVIEDIVIDGISLPDSHNKYLFENRGIIKNVEIKNSQLNKWAAGTTWGVYYNPTTATVDYTASAEKLTLTNCTTLIPTGAKLVSFGNNNNSLGELEIIEGSLQLTNTVLVSIASLTGVVFGKLTMTDTTFKATNQKPIFYGRGMLHGDNTIFTRVKFVGLERLVYLHVSATPVNATQRYIDCEFDTSLTYIAVNTTPNYIINVIMTGTKFINPIANLFATTQGDGSITIDVSGSVNNVVTPAKVRNSTQVTVVACDIPYV